MPIGKLLETITLQRVENFPKALSEEEPDGWGG
jgi:hypothetical protein